MRSLASYLFFITLIHAANAYAQERDFSQISDQEWQNGIEIPRSNWNGKGVKGQDGKGGFYLSRGKANISTKNGVHIPTEFTSGIFLDFYYTSPNHYHNLALEWRYPGKGWDLRQGVHFQLPNALDDHYQVYIPYTRNQKKKKLGVLRIQATGCENCKIYLEKTYIVGQNERSEFLKYTPSSLSSLAGSSGSNSVQRAFIKFAHDKFFFIVYWLILLSVLFTGIWIIYRQKHK